MDHPNRIYMERAIEEAIRAMRDKQYPIGSVVVLNSEILSIAHTTLHETNDPSAHAEMNAVRSASLKINDRYLNGAWLYTTQEPCPMCVAVAIWAKMEGVVYGANTQDALEVYKKKSAEKFTWRQIDISAEDIIAKGEPTLKLYKDFMREECLRLHELSG